MERIKPQPGQESVWDYPRPPRIEDSDKRVRVKVRDHLLADSNRSKRVLETSHPPVFYIPPEDVDIRFLHGSKHASFCEWKGSANYYSYHLDDCCIENIAWTYLKPTQEFSQLASWLAFYPSKANCFLEEEIVVAQKGDFYGGWITSTIVGPFKGGFGTSNW